MPASPEPRPRVKPELAAVPPEPAQRSVERSAGPVPDSVITEPLRAVMRRQPAEPIGVVIELRTADGIARARRGLATLVSEVTQGREKVALRGESYVTLALTAAEIEDLATRDGTDGGVPGGGAEGVPQGGAGPGRPTRRARAVPPAAPASGTPTGPGTSHPAPRRHIQRIWPNFEITGMTLRSVTATKCRAAQRTFDATGAGMVWAVLDSGIDRKHRHFAVHGNLDLPSGLKHRSFIPEVDDPLVDANGHGTHVAGIIAGGLAADDPAVGVGWYLDAQGVEQRQALPVGGIGGMAPACKLLSCTVLRPDRTGDLAALLDALLYIQQLNDGGRQLRVHGVNISVGHMFDPTWFAAGRTPVCREVDRLVASGVVVVVAAGNTGYGYANDPNGRAMRLGFGMTINDPGNAARAITVGSTSSSPHTSGVSYFSSKGPTGDGRMKPDLVAPGERIISAAAGLMLKQAQRAAPNAEYIESTGTSMAAPHVSGAAAGLLSVFPELVGQPDRVKEVLRASATDIGREPSFQGAGMLDAMRALQSI